MQHQLAPSVLTGTLLGFMNLCMPSLFKCPVSSKRKSYRLQQNLKDPDPQAG